MEVETSDGQTSDIRLSRACSALVLRRKIAGSLEPGAKSGVASGDDFINAAEPLPLKSDV